MRSKFVYKFSLILFALTTFNSFCIDERQKLIACQNLSSEGKMAKMSKKEMIENFIQCTGITDRNCIEIIQKKLNPAEKNSNVNIAQKIMLEGGRIISVGFFTVSFVGLLGSIPGLWFSGKSWKLAGTAGLSLLGIALFGGLGGIHQAMRMNHEKE